MKRQKYFSIHGNERDGWKLGIYEHNYDQKKDDAGNVVSEVERDDVSPILGREQTQTFPRLADLLQVLMEHEEISP